MEEAIIAKLLADSGVTAIVQARVFPVSRPQGTALPAVTVTRVSGGPEYADDGEAGLEEARIQIDCRADTYQAAKLLARAVTASLSAFQGTVGATTFQDIELDIERDLRESGTNAADYPFRISLDFIVWAER
jgi:hypothetical protein